MRWSLLLVLVGGCFSKPPAPGEGGGGDGGTRGDGNVSCQSGTWTTSTTNLQTATSTDWSPTLSPDGYMVFLSDRVSIGTAFIAKMTSPGVFENPAIIAGPGSGNAEVAWNHDGTAIFVTDVGGTIGKYPRLASSTSFNAVQPPMELSGLVSVHDLAFRSDGLEIIWSDSTKLHIASRSTLTEAYAEMPGALDAVNTMSGATALEYPTYTSDGLTLYFIATLGDGPHVYSARRDKFGNAFSAITMESGLPGEAEDLEMARNGDLYSAIGGLDSTIFRSSRCP